MNALLERVRRGGRRIPPAALSGPVQCVGIRTVSATGEVIACPELATVEILRSCHGEVKTAQVCAQHREMAEARPGKCRPCGGRTVWFISARPIGGGS